MISPFQLELPNAAAAYAVHVTEVNELHSRRERDGTAPAASDRGGGGRSGWA